MVLNIASSVDSECVCVGYIWARAVEIKEVFVAVFRHETTKAVLDISRPELPQLRMSDFDVSG